MRKFVLVAAMVLASAGAQAGDSRSLSTGSTPSDLPAATTAQSKPGTLRADTETTATPAAAPLPAPAAETPRYAPPPADASKPADTTRNTEPPAAATPRYTARPAPVDTTPSAAATRYRPSPRQANYQRSHMRHASYGYGRPHYRAHHWSAGRIIAALHRYGIYW